MRPRALSPEQEIEIARRYAAEGLLALSRAFGVTKQTICNVLRRAGVSLKRDQARLPERPTTPVKCDRPIHLHTMRRRNETVTPRNGLATCSVRVVEEMCETYHVYRSAGPCSTYCFAVSENGRPVAAFAWQPTALGAARAVCPEAPQGVLALSRMVAVPRNERDLRHLSKPLREQMHKLIDRTRWPVLITFSDEGQGHTGHVYKCSGWEKTTRSERSFYVDSSGRRRSVPTSDHHRDERDLRQGGKTVLQRWEHWACPRGEAARWMTAHGWRREPIPGRVWRSGNPAFTWIRQ